MNWFGPLALFVGLLGGCGVGGGSIVRPPVLQVRPVPGQHSVSIRPGETRTFAPGTLQPGDVIVCEVGGHPFALHVPSQASGGWSAFAGGNGGQIRAREPFPGAAITASCKR